MSHKSRHSMAPNNISIVNSENLIALVKNIAFCQAQELSKTVENKSVKTCGLEVKSLASKLTDLNLFDAVEKAKIEQEIEALDAALQTITAKGILVRNHGIGEYVPIAYEVISLIFVHTTEKFRQKHFRQLLELFYSELLDNLKLNGSKVCLERSKFESEVKCLLPIIKLQVILELENDEMKKELASNLKNFFNNPRMNQEDIYVVVFNKVGSNRFVLNSYELSALDQRNGHLGDYYQLKVDIERDGVEEKLYFFAKFLTAKADFLRELLTRGPSMKEEFFYMVFLPKLWELGLSEISDFAPGCYFSRVDDVLVLDDMAQNGFVGLTPNIKLEYSALKLAVRELAKLHSCTLILEKHLSRKEGRSIQLGDLYGDYLKEVVFVKESENMKLGIEATINTLLHILTKFPELKKNYSDEELKQKAVRGFDLLFEKIKPSEKFRNVIVHGDVYVSNMLFNFRKNGECRDVKLIDFQILRYCPPTQDLLFFLYQNSLKKTLDVHFNDLVQEYYDTLSRLLAKHHIDIDDIYSRDNFDKCIEYMKSEGIFHTLSYSPFQTVDPKLREKLFQDEKEMEKVKDDPLFIINKSLEEEHYREVMKGLCEYFIELCDSGYL